MAPAVAVEPSRAVGAMRTLASPQHGEDVTPVIPPETPDAPEKVANLDKKSTGSTGDSKDLLTVEARVVQIFLSVVI